MGKSSSEKHVKLAIAGNPNSGKTTLFNILTGLNQRTGNFAGVTVERKSGYFNTKDSSGRQKQVEIVDLPGAYSLNPLSPDERIASQVLTNSTDADYPDGVIVVADASNLKRNLFLVTQIIDTGLPVVLVLNMIDQVEKQGEKIHVEKLSEQLGVNVYEMNARKKIGVHELQSQVLSHLKRGKIFLASDVYSGDDTKRTIERYRRITELLETCVFKTNKLVKESFTSKIDKVFTHPFWGYVIFLVILFSLFQSIFYLASFPMHWIEQFFVLLSANVSQALPQGELNDLLVNGVLAGLSGVMVFIPQIALLFMFIAILEDTGYMARVSFIMDRAMKKFGLNGRSVIPLISGMACAVPAIMGTRTIPNRKERLITILVTPLMSCSARLPVFTLLISLIIPAHKSIAGLNFQGLALMGMYLLGFVAVICASFVFKYMIKSNERSYFIMELPVYRSPRMYSVLLTIIDKVKIFIWDAGKVILAISIVLWMLSSHAPGNKFAEIERSVSANTSIPDSLKQAEVASQKLETSYAGRLGKLIVPVIAPLGYDWKTGIALVTSFAAREVFVGTMATLYSVGDKDNYTTVREKMLIAKDPISGKNYFSLAVCVSLLLFYAFAMQCMSTLAVVYRETQSWKWPVVQFIYMGVLAYVSSFAAYWILS